MILKTTWHSVRWSENILGRNTVAERTVIVLYGKQLAIVPRCRDSAYYSTLHNKANYVS